MLVSVARATDVIVRIRQKRSVHISQRTPTIRSHVCHILAAIVAAEPTAAQATDGERATYANALQHRIDKHGCEHHDCDLEISK